MSEKKIDPSELTQEEAIDELVVGIGKKYRVLDLDLFTNPARAKEFSALVGVDLTWCEKCGANHAPTFVHGADKPQ